MADKTRFIATEWTAALDALKGPLRESLARRMLVSGGVVLRDEAEIRARVSFAKSEWNYNPSSRGSQAEGTLADAIYLAKNDKLTTGTTFTYSVSWNQKKAFWGVFREFGYFRKYLVVRDKDGFYHSLKNRPLAQPIWIPAHPVLGPAFDSKIESARTAMIERGRQELPVLLKEMASA